MRLRSIVVSALLVAVACGGDDDAPDAAPGEPDAGGAGRLVAAFVFDQDESRIVRYADGNGDGDAMDAGEVTIFFDDEGPLGIYNSLGIVALGTGEIFATDNVAGDNNDDSNVIHLVDGNGDGDALDPGEAVRWWDGTLPAGGGASTLPVGLGRGPDGALYLTHNDAFDEGPDAVYRLADDDGDGDADDAGEATVHFDLGAALEPDPQFLEWVIDAAGAGYGININYPPETNNPSLHRLAPDGGALTQLIDSVGLLELTFEGLDAVLSSGSLTYDETNQEIVVETITYYADPPQLLVGLRDLDDSGAIDDPLEVRGRFNEDVADVTGLGAFRDLVWLPDGSLVGGDSLSDRLFQLIDGNGDGDFDDPGEVHTLYDAALADAAGLPVINSFLTVAVVTD